MLEIVLTSLVIFMLLVLISAKKPKKRSARVCPHGNLINDIEFPDLPQAQEISMVELEQNSNPVLPYSSIPDVVGNMWKTTGSLPNIDGMGRYQTSWSESPETKTWNRYSIDRFGGMADFVKGTSPCKNTEMSN